MIATQPRKSSMVSNSGTMLSALLPSPSISPVSLSKTGGPKISETASVLEIIAVTMADLP